MTLEGSQADPQSLGMKEDVCVQVENTLVALGLGRASSTNTKCKAMVLAALKLKMSVQ